jgi:hypothetical protein
MKMNWEKRNKLHRPQRSTKDEREYRDNDAAARWLAKHDKRLHFKNFKVTGKRAT